MILPTAYEIADLCDQVLRFTSHRDFPAPTTFKIALIRRRRSPYSAYKLRILRDELTAIIQTLDPLNPPTVYAGPEWLDMVQKIRPYLEALLRETIPPTVFLPTPPTSRRPHDEDTLDPDSNPPRDLQLWKRDLPQ